MALPVAANGTSIVGGGDFNGDGLTDFFAYHTRQDHPAGAAENGADYLLIGLGDGHFRKLSTNSIRALSDEDAEVKASASTS